AVADRGLEATEETDVLVVDVHVDEPPQLPLLDEPFAQPGMPRLEVGEQLAESRPLTLDGPLAGGVLTKDRGDPDLDGHGGAVSFDERGGHGQDGLSAGCNAATTRTSSSVTSPSTMRNERTSTSPGS